MKQSVLNLGKALNKAEQKSVNGGRIPMCSTTQEPCYCQTLMTWMCVPNGTCASFTE